ncbi:energy transducer TonB [Flavobacterium agrisoli]|uniref:Energy transducer TonB n=1 Tax=Flavobacterium agrisoli TaxID=2793066 RepID=A0A934UKF7_9FLAO|nr:energy transducer TonB [Flavobacterium agrisoli]MBK0370395.1 energy transducer TonB [Flavobacterium agrisoli]
MATKEGKATYYYKNGTKKSETNYIKGRTNGNDFEWYENGSKKLEAVFIEDSKTNHTQHKIKQYWDENGTQKVTDGNGYYEESLERFYGKGNIKNGFKDGNWQGWVVNPNIKYNEYYNNGKFVTGTTTDEKGTETTYDALEKKPEPKNGIMSFYHFIGKNYNTSKLPKGLKGKIYTSFIVDKDGKITEPKILRDIGHGTGAEAIRVLNEAENWNPGEQRGRKVRVLYSLPITIQPAN